MSSEYSFATPASVRALTVPVLDTRRVLFNRYSKLLESRKEVRSVDLTPNPGIFNPQAYPSGRIVYNLSCNNDDSDTLFLHDFEPFRKTFVVIGIAQWSEESSSDDTLRSARDKLAKEFSSTVSHFLIVFDAPDDSRTKVDRIYLVNAKHSNLETVICEMTSRFLVEFNTYASSYEHVTLRSPGSIAPPMSSGASSQATMAAAAKKKTRHISGSFDLSQDKKDKYQTKGRRLKLYGSFFLLAGNLKKALAHLSEAIFYLRGAGDYLWLASALDSLAACIFQLAFIDAPFQLPGFVSSILDDMPTTSTPLNPNRAGSVSSSSAKKDSLASPFGSPSASPRPSMQLPQSISSAIQAASSVHLTPLPLSAIAKTIKKVWIKEDYYYRRTEEKGQDYVPQLVSVESNVRYAGLFANIEVEGQLDKSVIEADIYGRPLSKKQISPDVDFDHVQMGSILSKIFSDRFREMSVRQKCSIYNCVAQMCGKLRLERKQALILNAYIDLLMATPELGEFRGGTQSGPTIEALLRDHCEVYGISPGKVPSIHGPPNAVQRDVLLKVFTFVQTTQCFTGVVNFGSALLSDFYTLLDDDTQRKIYDTVQNAMPRCEKTATYWDQNLLKGITLDHAKDKLIQNELCDATIAIRNPFAFEIEVVDLAIKPSEDTFQLKTGVNSRRQNLISVQHKVPILLRPRSTAAVPVFVIPQSSGDLKIEGITATVCGCQEQVFKSFPKSVPTATTVKATSGTEQLDIKSDKLTPKAWDIDVIYEQPLLKLVDVKLSNKWILLLEGECKKFDVVLKNSSHVDINNMTSTFIDSTIEPLKQLLSNKNLPPNEVYEIEYYLINKKPFKILNKAAMADIPGDATFKLEMEIWGKRGVNEATIILEYAHSDPEGPPLKFSRTISIPVNVTIYPSVELVGCDIIPLSSHTRLVTADNRSACWEYLERMQNEGYKLSDFCLLALDFLNSWTENMTLSVQSLLTGSEDPEFQEQNGLIDPLPNDGFATQDLHLLSKKSVRVLIPIKRMDMPEEYLDQRIPSLRNKQFIYDSSTPAAEQRFVKHAFWYRDELLKRIRACWQIPDNIENTVYAGRSGTVDLRSIRFSSKMVNTLEVEKIGVQLTLLDENGDKVDSEEVQLNEFYTIQITVTNRTHNPVFGMIRHIPICHPLGGSLEKKVLFNGVLQSGIDSPLEPGAKRDFPLGVVFLEKGEYEWGALFDGLDETDGKLNIKEQHLQREQLKLAVC